MANCAACGRAVRPRSRDCGPCYCGLPECRRERRRLWQARKRREDADYRLDQARAQRSWAERHPDYWRDWRRAHPGYGERNRLRQRERDHLRRAADLAKMDSRAPVPPVSSGIYRILPATPGDLAKMDSWTARIVFLSRGSEASEGAVADLAKEDSIGLARSG
jgi:hypothetical protein